MPVVIGIVMAVIFLIAFSGWFYHLVEGWREFVLDDIFFGYRIAGVSLLSFLIMGGTFYGIAYFKECPNEERVGIFAKLNCKDYEKIMAGTDALMMKAEKSVE